MKGYDAYAATNNLVNEDDKPAILLKLYRTLIDKHEIVKVAIKEKDYKKKYEELSKITQVLQVLNSSLDMSHGEIPKNLSSMYTYLVKRLNDVHQTLDIATITESEELIKTILEGFIAAYGDLKKQHKQPADKSQV